MSTSIANLYINLSQASELLPVIAGFVYYRKLDAAFRLLLYYFLISICFEILATVAGLIWHNNMPGLHVYSIVQFSAFSRLYYGYFRDNRPLQRLVLVNAIGACIIALTDALFINGILHSNTVSRSYTAISIVVYALIHLYRIFREDTQQSRFSPMYWVTVAVLVYFTNNIFYFMLREHLLAYAKHVEMISFYVYAGLTIVANILYAQSFRSFSKWSRES